MVRASSAAAVSGAATEPGWHLGTAGCHPYAPASPRASDARPAATEQVCDPAVVCDQVAAGDSEPARHARHAVEPDAARRIVVCRWGGREASRHPQGVILSHASGRRSCRLEGRRNGPVRRVIAAGNRIRECSLCVRPQLYAPCMQAHPYVKSRTPISSIKGNCNS